MSGEQLARVMDIIKARPHFSSPMSVRRAGWEALAGRFAVPDDVEFTPADCGGVPALWVKPPNADKNRIVFYIHGGGFVLGSSHTYREFTSRLARAAKARALVIDYRLAPENSFPAGLEDCVTAYEWLLDQGHEPKDIAVGGDSAGATLILGMFLILKSKNRPLPACFGAICGWYDLTNSSESIRSNGTRDVFVPPNFNDAAAKIYLQNADPKDPLASPLLAI
jgi:epsilon-lactone hydrolase